MRGSSHEQHHRVKGSERNRIGMRGASSALAASTPRSTTTQLWPEDQKVVAEELGPYLAGLAARARKGADS